MSRSIKYGLVILFTLLLSAPLISYLMLTASLPRLDGELTNKHIASTTTLTRDTLGQAVIHSENLNDALYALGFAHGQDRLFQMDAQRRAASGRLSELFGKTTLEYDIKARFHQFTQRARTAFAQLPLEQQTWLQDYANGINDAVEDYSILPLEYLLTQSQFETWQPEDSLLVIYSMYMDLQQSQIERDLALTRIAHHFGEDMVDFLLQPSHYQAALDGSLRHKKVAIPTLPKTLARSNQLLTEPLDIGSNSWAVSGALTASKSAMLANDMHLGLGVPIIWYRTQLNYIQDEQNISVTGVSLPGLPGIIVGTNGAIAWGFTNSNLDNTDWVALSSSLGQRYTPVTIEVANDKAHTFNLLESEYGPVRQIGEEFYGLSWVAHQPYAVNTNVFSLYQTNTVDEALNIAHSLGMPVQNLTLADASGNIAWTPGGAVTARVTPSNIAIPPDQFDARWNYSETQLPQITTPNHQRIWTANARVMSTKDMMRFGDGGYAIGARGTQIRDRLFERNQFDESQFYAIQLDNEARFLIPWQSLLFRVLNKQPQQYSTALQEIKQWQSCACSSSVGYTLVRRFRSQVISTLFDPLATTLEQEDVKFRPILRHIETATWQLINQKPKSWLPQEFTDWDSFLINSFDLALRELQSQFGDDDDLQPLQWGKVNRLHIKHPFGDSLPLLGNKLHMASTVGFGDSYTPAVQGPSFGASQRLFVRPGNLNNAILTLPGGQSGHVLSPFYRAGFDEYIDNKPTPLLPQEKLHTLTFFPSND